MAIEKTVKYSNGQFNMRASAASLITYREQFGVEYTSDFSAAVKSPLTAVKVGYRLIWAMAKCADNAIPDPETFREMLGDDFDILGAVDDAAELMHKSLGGYAEETADGEVTEDDENLSEKMTGFALRCGFSVADLNDISVGFLLRCIENFSGDGSSKSNTADSGVRDATADDVANFVKFLGG